MKALKRTTSLTKPILGSSSKHKTLRKKKEEKSSESIFKPKRSTLKHSLSLASIPTNTSKKILIRSSLKAKPYRSMILANSDWKIESSEKKFTYFTAAGDDDKSSWYTDSFLGNNHQNFVASDKHSNPVSISVLKEGDYCKLIYRTIDGDQHFSVPIINNKIQSMKKLIKQANPTLTLKQIREIKSERHIDELKTFQNNEVHKQMKFGVVYCKKGQTDEDEMFSNNEPSKEFEEFLKVLGDTVELKGFKGYSGGLDTTKNATGSHSIYTKYNDHEIMFHVSTMLPYKDDCKQQLERKRHIGNDIVVIVFLDGHDDNYIPNTIKTHFQHILAVVQRDDINGGRPRYRLQMARKRGVPKFEPQIPSPSTFESDESFRSFLLTKLINGENASMHAPAFKSKIERTRSGLLTYYGSEYLKK